MKKLLVVLVAILFCVLSSSAQSYKIFHKNYVFERDTFTYVKYNGGFSTLEFPGGKIIHSSWIEDIVKLNKPDSLSNSLAEYAVFSATNGSGMIISFASRDSIIREEVMPRGNGRIIGYLKLAVFINGEEIFVYPSLQFEGEDEFPGVYIFYQGKISFFPYLYSSYTAKRKTTPEKLSYDHGIFTLSHYEGITSNQDDTTFVIEKDENNDYKICYLN